MQQRLSIGDFAAMTHLSVKTLRRYHDIGLLEPAQVDEWSGYRYYEPAQIPAAQMIRRLRDLDMPVREIGDLLTAGHLRRLEDRLEQTRDSVAALRRLLNRGPSLNVERRSVPARTVAAISGSIGLEDLHTWYADAMTELEAATADLASSGPPGSFFDNELFTEDAGALTVFIPLDAPPTTGRVRPLTIPAAELAVAVHVGSHTDIDVTYGQLGQWVLDRDVAGDGVVYESYPIGPRDTSNPEEWRTEIGWPVRNTLPSA
jgi:DNA-binding transcriptional MerR regulator